MPKKPPLARISITIPADLLKAADRLAAELDRSRSWVMGEAVRRWVVAQPIRRATSGVREPSPWPYGAQRAGLGESRQAQLEADMTLSVDDRIRQAEEGLEADARRPTRAHGTSIRFFDRYEDYLDWKKFEGINA